MEAVGEADGGVGDPAAPRHDQPPTVESPGKEPGARSTEVYGGVVAPGGPHRKNAAATPASTGTSRPVV